MKPIFHAFIGPGGVNDAPASPEEIAMTHPGHSPFFPTLAAGLAAGIAAGLTAGCAGDMQVHTSDKAAPVLVRPSASLGLVGNPGDAITATTPGTLLMGGGPDVDAAMQWMIEKSGGGDFVVIRATGTNAYNEYIYGLGAVDSVETLLIDSRTVANDPAVEARLRAAEAVFIAGGDQFNYVSFWKGTRVNDALSYLIHEKGVPVGGTSAGCAIQGEVYFSAANGTITSRDALRNPYDTRVSLGRSDFLSVPYLEDTITDTHYDNPDRRGRHVTFLARMVRDWQLDAKGIGVDEETAVAIEPDGTARVFGFGQAFFLRQNGQAPETCAPRTALDWYRGRRAVEVYKVAGSASGAGFFDLATWSQGSGGSWQFYYVDRGQLGVSF